MRKTKQLKLPPEPTDMDFEIPERLQYARYGKPDQIKILLADSREMHPSEDNNNSIIIFCHQAIYEFIHLIKHAHVDGTFSIAPKIGGQPRANSRRRALPETIEDAIEWSFQQSTEQEQQQIRRFFGRKFAQVYVIMGERRGAHDSKFVAPLLHVLMIRSDEEAYEKMWTMIKVKLSGFNPSSVSGDYELAAINAVLNAYSHSNIKYFELPFIFDKVEEYAKVVAELITEPALLDFKKLFFKTWIGNSTLEKLPRYKHEWWNLFERIKNGESATNNYSESDNACLSKLMGVKKPGVWRFMLRLEAVYYHYEAKYREFLVTQVIRKKSTYEEMRMRVIKETVERFEQLTAKEYLYAMVKATSTCGS